MNWSKLLANILLLAVCTLVEVKCSSSSDQTKVTKMLSNFEDVEETQAHHLTSNKPKALPWGFEEGEKQVKLESIERRQHLNPIRAATILGRDIFDTNEHRRTMDSASKAPEPNHLEILKQNVALISKKDVEKTSLRRAANEMLFADEDILDHDWEFWHSRKRANKKTVSARRLAKRNVNISEATQPTLISTTSQPSPSFKIPPACSRQQSCSGRCKGDGMEFQTDENLACYCDSACYEIFNDCCADYTTYCGDQKPRNVSFKKLKWTCEPLRPDYRSNQSCAIGDGIWMVSRCSDDWPYDEIRSKCENLTNSIRKISDIKRFVPIVSDDLTFRNYFCAECNHMDSIYYNVEYFSVKMETNIIPPKHYNFHDKVNFLLANGAKFLEASPESYQTRRYCLKSVVQSCTANTSSESCINGPVALVTLDGKQFKNFDCALCNKPNRPITCFPSLCGFIHPLPLSHKFLLKLDYANNEQYSAFTILKTNCSDDLIYDVRLQDCVKKFAPPSAKEDRVRVLAWISPSKDSQFSEQDFRTIMELYFGVENSHVCNVSIETVKSDTSPQASILYYRVGSTILLTTEQSFDTLFKINPNSSRLNLQRFIHFENPLSVTLKNVTYTIIKTTCRPLSCIAHKVYTPQQYVVGNEERIEIKWTYVVYRKWEYFGQIDDNITVCETYSQSNCEKNQTGFTKYDFIINSNLSLYKKDAGILYELGKYDVVDNTIELCILEQSDIPTCSSENSCKGHCTNYTQWQTETKMRCSCDPDCYEVFNDCCSDYTKYCGAQTQRETLAKKYNYSCEAVGHYVHRDSFDYVADCPEGDGVWMVSRCGPDWSNDTVRTKCEIVPVNDTTGYLPVVGYDNTTFRNRYCAICNGIERFEPWPLDDEVGSEDKKQFVKPGRNQTRRYCLNKMIDSCPRGKRFESCTNGDVAIVSHGTFHFKNAHCAISFGLPRGTFSCFTWKFEKTLCKNTVTRLPIILPVVESEDIIDPIDLSAIFEPSLVTVTRVSVVVDYSFEPRLIKDNRCGIGGKAFNNNSQNCQVNWYAAKQDQPHGFRISASLKPTRIFRNNTAFTATEFKNSLAKYLNISPFQLLDILKHTKITKEIETDSMSSNTTTTETYFVSSIVVLTPQQSLELHINQSKSKLFNYIHFSDPFTLQIKNISYTVTKKTSQPLVGVCDENGDVFISSTNQSYQIFECLMTAGNITVHVFKKYIPTKCNGSVVLYTAQDYTILGNSSIYVKKTSSLYGNWQYHMLPNKSVTICFEVHILNVTRRTLHHKELPGLGYITFISFLLSILCLIFLLVTYTLFPQLRTLPGKNLVNFAVSLLLFQIFWLPLNFTDVQSNKPACKAVAVVEHYFLIASFVSMSVIAFHTCKVFARSLPAPKMSAGGERKLFCIYAVVVWILPAVFVGICLVLDADQDVVELGYGDSEICWLTGEAYPYFVTIPIAILLLFNIVAFAITAVYFRKNTQDMAARQARRSNLSIFIKLSTLMGFTWLFGLLAVVVTSTTVFWYFFVILTSLQGVFVAMAFVFNAKTFSLYKQRHGSGTKSSSTKYTNSYGKKKSKETTV